MKIVFNARINLHLTDILQIPTLGLTRKLTAYRFGGGSYGKEYDKIILNANFSKGYRKIFDLFSNKAKKLDKIKQTIIADF